MRYAWLFVLYMVAGCSASTTPQPDAGLDAYVGCDGPAPLCATWYGECCDDILFQGTCREGAWVCDPCVLGESSCSRIHGLMSECTRAAMDAPLHGITAAEYCGLADGG